MNQVIEFFEKLFDSNDWPPRWHCGKWTDFHGWLYIVSDLMIWSAYFAIPLVIIKYVSRKNDVRFTKLYFLFAAFILACGATHFLDAVAFWIPVYRVSAVARFITGVISWVTVFYLIKFLPSIFSLRSQAALENEIEERKKAEDALGKLNEDLEQKVEDRTVALRQSEQQYRYLFQNNPMPMWVLDLSDFKFLDVNEMAILRYGYSRQEFLAMTAIDIRPEEDKEAFIKSDHSQSAKEPNYNKGIWKHRKKDGTIIQVEIIGHSILFEGISARLILANDVTAQQMAADKIAKNEKRFRALLENNYDMISLLDDKLKVFYRSPSAAKITGWTDVEIANMDSIENIHPDDKAIAAAVIKELMASRAKPIHTLFRSLHKSGHYIWLEGRVTNLLHDENIKAIVFNFRDVTETKNAEEKIRDSERIYRTIASSIPDSAILLFDRDLKYLLIEGDMLEKFGYSKEQLLGNTVQNALEPARYKQLLPNFERVFNGEVFTTEATIGEFHISTRYVPLCDETGKVYAAMMVVIDVSELKKAEREISELNAGLEQKIIERTNQLAAANKELEAFSYSVSHDLRAPLRAVNGYASMLEEDYATALDENGKRLLRTVQENAKQMGQLIDDLLAFSRLGRKEVQKAEVDMMLLTESVIEEIKIIYPKVQLHVDRLHPALGDVALLKQVLFNYISNAAKYSSNSENPVVKIKSTIENDYVLYSVTDNGAGFDMNYAHKLFQVFQRLHSHQEFEGTGVGLAIVDRIIGKHHGKVWAEGELGKGATFYFSLPTTILKV